MLIEPDEWIGGSLDATNATVFAVKSHGLLDFLLNRLSFCLLFLLFLSLWYAGCGLRLRLLCLVYSILLAGDDDPALRAGYGVPDKLLMLLSEVILMQIEKFELMLSGDKRDQRVHAVISSTFKPVVFTGNGEVM